MTLFDVFSGRSRRLAAYWNALDVGVEIVDERARTYLRANVGAPLYRLPEDLIRTSFAALLTDAALTRHEIRTLTLFVDLVGDINRGLDLVARAHDRGDTVRRTEEAQRLRSKCDVFLTPDASGASPLDRARAVVANHVGGRP